ncbi:MAG: lactate utilization protein [Desulfarculus sp.]|nr:lactate utilization protein [Desulfarculus sp.]
MQARLKPVADQRLASILASFTTRFQQFRQMGLAEPGLAQHFRERARAAKLTFLADAGHWLGVLADALEAQGVAVHFAENAAEARQIILSICQAAGARSVVKSKSMVCEEVRLNPALEEAGLTVSETDLGEFIIQLAGETPFHILGPALHKDRGQVAELFRDKLGEQVSDEPAELTQAARRVLRKRFLEAEVGISGVNIAACQSGTLAVITNEGNGRFCTSLPPVHIAVMGLEKAVPTLADLALIAEYLPRAAIGAPLSSYASWVGGPAALYGGHGPRQSHVVILDNGRSGILASPYWEILLCLRCASCLNHCPVYGLAGGHAYGGIYTGPMGSVLTALLEDQPPADDLPHASSLCGLCREKCPMGIDLPGLLLRLRQESPRPPSDFLPGLAAQVLQSRGLFQAACRVARPALAALEMLPRPALPPGPWRAWRQGRSLPRVPGSTLLGGGGQEDGDG